MLIQFLEGDLSEEREPEVLHMIAEDEEMRSLLQFELSLRRSASRIPGADSFSVPGGFSANVMQAIEARETQEAESGSSLWDELVEALENLWRPRELQYRPAFALAAAVAIVSLFVLPQLQDENISRQQFTDTTPRTEMASAGITGQDEQVWTRFVYIDKDAESVAVAGDFSDWDPVNLNRKTLNGQEVWTGLVPMKKGEHRYMFVKNGREWVTDPLATNYENDGFGNKNAVIYL